MLKSQNFKTNNFRRDERGSVAIIGGISAFAICMMVGMAIDVGRAMSSKSKVNAAADAAALAAAKAIRLENASDSEAMAIARKVFDENMHNGSGHWTTINSVNVVIDRTTSKASVTVDSSVPTTFAGIAGITKLQTPAAAAAVFETRDIEVAVQLDLTGSMCSPCTKIEALKTATTQLVDALIPAHPTAQKVRIGFAPFAAGVNVGPYLRDVNGNRASVNNCVYERITNTNDKTDEPPVGNDAFKIKSDLRGAIQACPATSEIVPLTSDRDALKAATNNFVASGSTAGQLGAAWAWNLISPKWSSIWPTESAPAAYGTANTDKIVILMTDGVYNTIGGVMYGDASSQATTASNISIDICNNMKDAGITVYTVGFDLDSIVGTTARTRATDTLKACAGRKGNAHPEDFFYKADDGDALQAAFHNVAADINRLRLTN